jgi:hypothetical protein
MGHVRQLRTHDAPGKIDTCLYLVSNHVAFRGNSPFCLLRRWPTVRCTALSDWLRDIVPPIRGRIDSCGPHSNGVSTIEVTFLIPTIPQGGRFLSTTDHGTSSVPSGYT